MAGVGISQLFNVLPALPAGIQQAASQAVRKAAFDIQALAQSNAPVDTGFLKNSIYVSTKSSSGYAGAASKSGAKNATGAMLPEVAPPQNALTAYIVVGADYGIYVELGTAHAPAQPFLLPAAEVVKPQYEAAMKAITNKAVSEALAAGLSGLFNIL